MSIRNLSRSLAGLFLLACTSPLFAQATTEAVKTDFSTLKMGGIAMALAAGLCGIGMGMGLKGTQEGIARNPGAADNIRTVFFIGFAFIESLALYTFLFVFLKY
ncbi:MAG TPA: ATP synthase F0 subunit C [Terriglobales bacterium]|nr:ATP synthase F0 subunit C [Terriglobales bacterium]